MQVYYISFFVLIDLGSTFSYVSTYLSSGFDVASEPHAMPFPVTFAGRESWVELIVLCMIDFDIILVMY